MSEHTIGTCPFCHRRVRCAGPMLGDPFWRVYCQPCDIATVFSHARYPAPAHVREKWLTLTAQGDLFGGGKTL